MSKWFFLAILMIAYSLSSIVSCIKKNGNQTSGGTEKVLDIGQIVLSVVLLILSCGIIIKELLG